MSEIGDAAQIVKIAMDGVEIAVKLGKDGVHSAEKLLKFILSIRRTMEEQKIMGKVDMKRLLQEGGDIQLVQIPEQDYKEFIAETKKYGILYSDIKDLNKNDNMREIAVHVSAVPRINRILDKTGYGKVITPEEYINNAEPEQLKEILQDVDKNLKDGAVELTAQEKQNMFNKLSRASELNNDEMVEVTINKKLVFSQDGDVIKTRIPYTDKFVELDAKHGYKIDDNTYSFFINKNAEMNILNKENNVVEKINGLDLYKKHYDKVSVHRDGNSLSKNKSIATTPVLSR